MGLVCMINRMGSGVKNLQTSAHKQLANKQKSQGKGNRGNKFAGQTMLFEKNKHPFSSTTTPFRTHRPACHFDSKAMDRVSNQSKKFYCKRQQGNTRKRKRI
jgi:hypothetical protein